MTKIQKRIWAAYVACERLCESDRDADTWLRKAFEEARAGEQQHRAAGRRFTQGSAGYKLPVADAARFFAVKWFLELGGKPNSFADACAMRPDCLFAKGARDRLTGDKLRKWAMLADEYADVVGLDYSEVFAA